MFSTIWPRNPRQIVGIESRGKRKKDPERGTRKETRSPVVLGFWLKLVSKAQS